MIAETIRTGDLLVFLMLIKSSLLVFWLAVTVVAPDQTCGVPGRYIGENVAFLRDVVELANEYNLRVALLSLDQEKAFDYVD